MCAAQGGAQQDVEMSFKIDNNAIDWHAQLNNIIFQHKKVNLSEPFLAPGERFDLIPTGDNIGNWVLAAVLEELERLGYFSSFYAGVSARQRLAIIGSLGFGSEEMGRRSRLLQRRFGLTTSELQR